MAASRARQANEWPAPTETYPWKAMPDATASPYATGGGGVTFERRVAATYLALMLTGEGAPELGEGCQVSAVGFQQAPQVAVDDLMIQASRATDGTPVLELALGVRRAPKIMASDEDTQNLVTAFVRAVLATPADRVERRFALSVAGPQTHARQLGQLASEAAKQMDPPSFFALLRTPKKFRKGLVDRLGHFEKLVASALATLGVSKVDQALVERRTWELLSRLVVLMPRLEDPDTSEWAGTVNRLVTIARGKDLQGARHLADRLEALAAQFSPAAATVDLTLLRREVHTLLELPQWRHSKGWDLVEHLQAQAFAAVRSDIGLADSAGALHLDRTTEGQAVIAAIRSATGTVVHGVSGVGKSALVLHEVRSTAMNSDDTQVVCFNLRQLPEDSFSFVAALGAPLEVLLRELSAPNRFLVIDGADAATERKADTFRYLVRAARESALRVIAITSTENLQLVHDALVEELRDTVSDQEINGLSEGDLAKIAIAFPALARLIDQPRRPALLQRLVVIDLLVRSQTTAVPLSDVDAMQEIWNGLVRRHERTDRGLPDARAQVLLRLAAWELSSTQDQLAVTLDPNALAGLQQDGLLRRPTENPWQILPEFAHDELRRFAAARVLLADGDPAAALRSAGCPRWALSSARLACQAMLGATAGPGVQLTTVQTAFDALAADYGARWGDVPGEALLTVTDASRLLTDAWPDLTAGDASGLSRLLRLASQHHQKNGLVDAVVVAPLVRLLLNEESPWWWGKDVANLFRDWLFALVAQDAPAGHPLRETLRQRLVAICAAGDRELREQQERAAAAQPTRTPEEVAADEEFETRQNVLRSRFGDRPLRKRPEIPHEFIDDVVLELLALLGRDLGEDGEQILRRVAQDAPWHLAPALEEVGTGRALASYGHGLLADLVHAYYLDEEEIGGGVHEEGIRHHHWRGRVAPLAAWYRGPFMALFQGDLLGGIRVLNQLLNHASLARARTLASLGSPFYEISDEALAAYRTELAVSGARRIYVGDYHVWVWYRGTGVGPYPCMSALQALERVCDQLIAAGVSLERLVPLLLVGCESLAMPGFVVGLLVRHLEKADALLDPFLAEPAIWQFEFGRLSLESTGLAASSDGLVSPDRRKWTFREAATWLVIHADATRAEQLRAVGSQLVAAAEQQDQKHSSELRAADASDVHTGDASVTLTTLARNWASALDIESYRAYTEGGSTYVHHVPPDDVQAALLPGNEELQRVQEAIRIQARYVIRDQNRPDSGEIDQAELLQDLRTAKELLEDPPARSPLSASDAPIAVAAKALEAILVRGMELPHDLIAFSTRAVLAVAEGTSYSENLDWEEAFYPLGADRIAARALPVLLLPSAAELRRHCATVDRTGDDRVLSACRRAARSLPHETRLNFGMGLDAVWNASCTKGLCHHEMAFDLAVDSMRDCVLGDWDVESQTRAIESLGDPVDELLAAVEDRALYIPRLSAAIRALGAAVHHDICIRERAHRILQALLLAQRRGIIAHENNDERGNHTIVAARALLSLASAADEQPLFDHITAFADKATRLDTLLRALAAVAEENEAMASTARRVWPDIVRRVLALKRAGHDPFDDRYFGSAALAALMPTPTPEVAFMCRELESTPLTWADVQGWRSCIDAWVPVASGRPMCVDSLIWLVQSMPLSDQVHVGLPWIASMVLTNVEACARQSYLLSKWLISIRATAAESKGQVTWFQVVDALVVAGNTELAGYSE